MILLDVIRGWWIRALVGRKATGKIMGICTKIGVEKFY
jgi:hypothetical protein